MAILQYITNTEAKVALPDGDTKTLPQGSFVKIIEHRYLPQHIKDCFSFRWKSIDEYFVYCHYGIVSIKKKDVSIA